MIILDLENAFDTVWHKGLIYKRKRDNLPTYVIKIVQNYIKNRRFVVSVNVVRSKEQNIEAGVPQGSIVGPVLFIFYINDITRMIGVLLSLFADDTATYTASMSKRLTVVRL